MKRVIVVYDDSFMPNKEIRTITGDKTYGETIFKRVTLKNRMKEETAKNRIASQKEHSFYEANSDYVIVNSGSLDDLKYKADKLIKELM